MLIEKGCPYSMQTLVGSTGLSVFDSIGGVFALNPFPVRVPGLEDRARSEPA